jgi:hypothetical protein
VLIDGPDARGTGVAGAFNHLEVGGETTDDVSAAAARLGAARLASAFSLRSREPTRTRSRT